VGAQPTATRDGLAWPRPARATRGARRCNARRRRCTVAVLHGGTTAAPTGAREMVKGRGGSPAWGRRRGTTVTGEWRGGTAMDRRRRLRTVAIGTAARAARQAARGCRASGERGEGRGGSPDSGLKAREQRWRMAATRQRRAARQARRGTRRLTGGAHSSAISELKITPDENS
jgi:hypothetical protein